MLAALAGRSTKGGHVALNRFKARVRHFFNWAIAQGYRDDTPFKRHGVNVVRLNTRCRDGSRTPVAAGRGGASDRGSDTTSARIDCRRALDGVPCG